MSAADGTPAADLPIRFGADGLVPVTVQDADTGDVLMLAFMNREALDATRATGEAHYWSRSRGKLWHKGESSGHVQRIEGIYVNCEQNSLLLRVRQTGAVCHDGYPTCYYRRLEPDGSLTVVAARAFDPSDVYGTPSTPDPALFAAARLLFGAYAYLRETDLTAHSGTSRRLRTRSTEAFDRVADELGELAGVLDGSHRHAGQRDDLILEGSQVVYWVLVSALSHGATWSDVALDRAFAVSDPVPQTVDLPSLADAWTLHPRGQDLFGLVRRTIAAVAATANGAGVPPVELLRHDLRDLRERPYLRPYFATGGERDA